MHSVVCELLLLITAADAQYSVKHMRLLADGTAAACTTAALMLVFPAQQSQSVLGSTSMQFKLKTTANDVHLDAGLAGPALAVRLALHPQALPWRRGVAVPVPPHPQQLRPVLPPQPVPVCAVCMHTQAGSGVLEERDLSHSVFCLACETPCQDTQELVCLQAVRKEGCREIILDVDTMGCSSHLKLEALS